MSRYMSNAGELKERINSSGILNKLDLSEQAIFFNAIYSGLKAMPRVHPTVKENFISAILPDQLEVRLGAPVLIKYGRRAGGTFTPRFIVVKGSTTAVALEDSEEEEE